MKKIILLLSFVCILGMTSKAQCPDSVRQGTTNTTIYNAGSFVANTDSIVLFTGGTAYGQTVISANSSTIVFPNGTIPGTSYDSIWYYTNNLKISTCITGGVLPVELISFNITRFGNSNMLYWTTASELNNAYFSIEKSINAKEFYSVGYVEGSGNTSSIINYEYLDLESRTVYYRLKQVDYDGNYEYSDIIKVILDEDPDLILTTIFTTQGQVVYIDDEPVDLSKIGKFGKVMVIKQYNKKPTTKEYKVLD